jgi:Mrp family chromosome partitioning ATPase
MSTNETLREPEHDMAAVWGSSLTRRETASRSIAHMVESRVLTRRQMEDRHLISREAGARGPADAFREIRTRLFELGGADNFTTLVVPVSSGAGGSFVARNLAAAFAFDEARTALLVDCNLRYPAQHRALDVDASHGGLIDFLEQPSRGVQHILYDTGIPRVRLIPAGSPRESSAEYLSSARMRTLVDMLRSRYADRYLILDGPALKGSPDARILAELVDLVVVVAGYGRDTASAITQATANLDPNKLAGVVFNYPPS